MHILGLIACVATLLGLAVAGAGHLAMSWFALSSIAAIGVGLAAVGAVCWLIVRALR